MNAAAQLARRLRRRAKTRWLRRLMVRSAVAAIVRERCGELEVLLIKRAECEGDRWSGHIAFPGGRLEQRDTTARAAARRETAEEIGLHLGEQHYLGRLSDVMTLAHGSKRPMVVSPYAFCIDKLPPLQLNHEVAEVIWVPLSFFADLRNRDSMVWQHKGVSMNLPCYIYQGHRIWGLTLRMLDELVALAVDSEKH